MPSFVAQQRDAQARYLTRTVPGHAPTSGAPYALAQSDRALNLSPEVREAALRHFRQQRIAWHQHARSGLSSQIACVNFLLPLATRPGPLAELVGLWLGIEPPEMLPVEDGPLGEPWFVGFEWIGERDYLGEGGRSRGQHVTSADAFVRFRSGGRIEGLLVEWKYTECYGQPPNPARTPERLRRYGDKAFAPTGPLRDDLGLSLADLFWDPFYQMLRQQMLAVAMERAGEGGVERMRTLYLSPAGNVALHAVTAPALQSFGVNAIEAFSGVLIQPTRFLALSIEDAFGPVLVDHAKEPWSAYLLDRYCFLGAAQNGT